MQLYGSASAEPFFVAPFPENWGARLRISGGCPARGEPEARINLCSSIACRAQPCQRCTSVLQALIIFQYALLRLCFGRASFLLLHSRRTGEHDCASPAVAPQGASRRRLLIFAQASRAGRSPASDAPSSPSADYISDATLRLCFGRAVFCFKEESAAKRCIPPFFARQTVLYYNSIGACRKGSKPVRFTQGSVSRARCTEKAVF